MTLSDCIEFLARIKSGFGTEGLTVREFHDQCVVRNILVFLRRYKMFLEELDKCRTDMLSKDGTLQVWCDSDAEVKRVIVIFENSKHCALFYPEGEE